MTPPPKPSDGPVDVPLKATLERDGSIMVWAKVGGKQVPILTVDAGTVRHWLWDVPRP